MFFQPPFILSLQKTTNSIKMSNPNPYMTCGACCAFFRVSFYWAEADDAGGNVPASLTEQISPLSSLYARHQSEKSPMSRSGHHPAENAYCSVYKNRPSICREFAMSGENGEINEACNRARAKYGLPEI
ncbi:YkgJ family cysteine cluster protein [Escherichia coli]|uniref:YkgJ family cysteine cluster protein n=1 Tax=Escherichia coli TaxID=562 RepID=UPI00114DCE3B|nr:YkgJ family cysteine cluster protein [Escherichia coli]